MIINDFVCPVCGKHTFRNNATDEMCPVCYWCNDIVQNSDPDYTGGANKLSLNEYRQNWENGNSKE